LRRPVESFFGSRAVRGGRGASRTGAGQGCREAAGLLTGDARRDKSAGKWALFPRQSGTDAEKSAFAAFSVKEIRRLFC